MSGRSSQGLGSVIVFWSDVQSLDQFERLAVHLLVVAQHVVGEPDDRFVLGLGDRLMGRVDVDHPAV
jgi:hypothetical protein